MSDNIRKYISRGLTTVAATLSIAAPLAHAEDLDFSKYDIYYGDVNGDNNAGDIYFRGKEQWVLIKNGGVDIPILYNKPASFAYINGQTELQLVEVDDAALGSFAQAKLDQNFYLANENTDALADARVYHQAGDGSGIIFYANTTNTLPSYQTFSYTDTPGGSMFASSSQITAAQAGIEIFTAPDSNIDILTPVKSVNGVSVNVFSEFNVQDRPLFITNASTYETNAAGESVETPMAHTIVIIADNVNLSETIEIRGLPADVVILSTDSSGSITCNSCVFKNALRVSLLTANPQSNVTATSTTLGNLSPAANTQININNLYAPGSIALDVVTADLMLNGVIDTNQRVIKDARGGYTNLDSGDLLMGASGVNMVLGENTWHYETQEIIASHATSNHILGGEIRSTGVKVLANGNLDMNTYIDTRTDVVSAVAYRNGTHITHEGISIAALGLGNLNLNNALISGGDITLGADGNNYINTAAQEIEAKNVKVFATSNVYNQAVLKGQTVGVGGAKIFNEGVVYGTALVEMDADYELANQYGGRITGETVKLNSENLVVRNGSRTPYISRNFESDYRLNLSRDSYGLDLDLSKMGTFYSLGLAVNTSDSGLTMAADNSAYIIADHLSVVAKGFENINPYYEIVKNDSVELDRHLAQQSFVSAENSLKIKTTDSADPNAEGGDYILNSSGVIALNNANGKIEFETTMFINERYRVVSILSKSNSNEFDANEFDGVTVIDSNSTTLRTQTVAYSPPAVLMSLGDLEVTATEAFVNSSAYVEVFGNATVASPFLDDFGLENQGITTTNSTALVYVENGYNQYGSQYSPYYTTYINERFYVDPQDLDSLFYIKGNLLASAADGWFNTRNIFNFFIEQSVEGYEEQHLADAIASEGTNGSVLSNQGGYLEVTTTDSRSTIEINQNTGNVAVVVTQSEEYAQYSHEQYLEMLAGNENVTPHTTGSGASSDSFVYNIVEELERFYVELRDSVIAFFDELDWWN